MKWYPFDKEKGWRQKRPPEKKWVLVQREPEPPHPFEEVNHMLKPGIAGLVATYPSSVAVGYRKDAAGDAQCPYFVVPGLGGKVVAWCDCLPNDFAWPEEEGG